MRASSDLYVRRRDRFHSTCYLLRALSCNITLIRRPQRQQHNKKWCLSPHISIAERSRWDKEPTHPDSELEEPLLLSTRQKQPLSEHFILILKKRQKWCYYCSPTLMWSARWGLLPNTIQFSKPINTQVWVENWKMTNWKSPVFSNCSESVLVCLQAFSVLHVKDLILLKTQIQ